MPDEASVEVGITIAGLSADELAMVITGMQKDETVTVTRSDTGTWNTRRHTITFSGRSMGSGRELLDWAIKGFESKYGDDTDRVFDD